jgi:poly-gamma-glutamate synthase PgsB/CapB
MKSPQRILVTGSRGKSSVVRMLHAALRDAGLETWVRITGVLPRELGPDGTRNILRSSGAHVEEMRWWLKSLPPSAEAIVLENSAISPDLQELAGLWLQPAITVFTNAVPDHQEAWGPTRGSAAEALAAGVPAGGKVVLPAALGSDRILLELLRRRNCSLVFADAAVGDALNHQNVNRGLAITTLETLGLDTAQAREAMQLLKEDRYDFRVVNRGGAKLAMAFSANDVASTMSLFRSLQWKEEETRLIYNHRLDRPGRFRSFTDWLDRSHWQEVLIIGDRPLNRFFHSRYHKARDEEGLIQLLHPGERFFGCGNIAGVPLSLY